MASSSAFCRRSLSLAAWASPVEEVSLAVVDEVAGESKAERNWLRSLAIAAV
jgi:hypothetical protein